MRLADCVLKALHFLVVLAESWRWTEKGTAAFAQLGEQLSRLQLVTEASQRPLRVWGPSAPMLAGKSAAPRAQAQGEIRSWVHAGEVAIVRGDTMSALQTRIIRIIIVGLNP
jgi:hypothetical protein